MQSTKKHHERVWPEVAESYRKCGIESMEIYLLGTRMFMIMEVNDRFSFEQKARADQSNPRLREWERLMERFQQASPHVQNGDKWKRMEHIFEAAMSQLLSRQKKPLPLDERSGSSPGQVQVDTGETGFFGWFLSMTTFFML